MLDGGVELYTGIALEVFEEYILKSKPFNLPKRKKKSFNPTLPGQ